MMIGAALDLEADAVLVFLGALVGEACRAALGHTTTWVRG